MHGVRDLETIYAFYRNPDLAPFGGPQMVRFLDDVADLLRDAPVFFGTSHAHLFLSRFGTYPDCVDNPTIGVTATNINMHFSYTEPWQDGAWNRRLEEHIICPAEDARRAFAELLARLLQTRTDTQPLPTDTPNPAPHP